MIFTKTIKYRKSELQEFVEVYLTFDHDIPVKVPRKSIFFINCMDNKCILTKTAPRYQTNVLLMGTHSSVDWKLNLVLIPSAFKYYIQISPVNCKAS